MKYLFIWLIRFYRRFLSPLKRTPTCRFTPTCSAYALEAFQIRGFFVGFLLTAFRILRCNPFCPGGYDPVPTHGFSTMGKGIEPHNETPPDPTDLPLPKRACEDYYNRSPYRTKDKEQAPCQNTSK